MQYLILTCWLCLIWVPGTMAQGAIVHGSSALKLTEFRILETPVEFREAPKPDDDEVVRLFKHYFNPGSFNTYRTFFLPGDWGGFTQADYDAWQARLHANTLHLERVIRLEDPAGNKFLILQYWYENPQHVIPSQAIFKRINHEWKHISNVNDKLAPVLKQIALLDNSILEGLSTSTETLDLSGGPAARLQSVEKFDRADLFERIRPVLATYPLRPEDMSLARTLFLEKAEVEMARFIAQTCTVDLYDLMHRLNTGLGFTLYKFANTTK